MKKSIVPFMLCVLFAGLFIINLIENVSISYLNTMLSAFLICASGLCLGVAINKIINK